MTLVDIVILAVIQGLTEFFPISSSGHLVLGQYILGVQAPGVALEVALHLGTLISVFVVFAKDIKLLFLAGLSFVAPVKLSGQVYDLASHRRLLVLLLLASALTSVIGLTFKDIFIGFFAAPRFVGLMLIVTGIILLMVARLQGAKTLSNMSNMDALAIGLAQGLAITPGISRSGLTIGAGLLLGFDRDIATRFSFLLSIPAIVGASFLEIPTLLRAQLDFPLWWVGAGVLVAAASGVVAILGLLQMLKRGKLSCFAYYVWVIGILTILLVR